MQVIIVVSIALIVGSPVPDVQPELEIDEADSPEISPESASVEEVPDNFINYAVRSSFGTQFVEYVPYDTGFLVM